MAVFLPGVLVGLLVGGCGDAHPIEYRAIVIAVGIAPGHNRGQDQWTFVEPNVTVTASSVSNIKPSNQYYSITVQAPTWPAALAAAEDHSSRDLYFGQLESVVWSDHLDGQTVSNLMQALNQDGLIPKTFWVATVPGSVSKLLTVATPQEVVPRYFLSAFFSCTTCHPINWTVPGWRWWSRRLTPGVNPIVPLVTASPSGLSISTFAVFRAKGPALVAPHAIVNGFAYLTNRTVKAVWVGTVDGQRLTVSKIQGHAATQVSVNRGVINARVLITVHGMLGVLPLGSSASFWLAKADTAVAQSIAHQCLTTVKWADATHTDPFGYGRNALYSEPGQESSLSPGRSFWRPFDVHVVVKARLRTAGTQS